MTAPPISRAEKLRLFGALFRGRQDIYARHWRNERTGKQGLAPACRNEWRPGLCGKPEIRCADCLQQAFLPLNADLVLDHLQGRDRIGVYVQRADSMVAMALLTFDGDRALDEVASTIAAARRWLPVAKDSSATAVVEQTAHELRVWFFFEDWLPAHLARRFLTAVLGAAQHDRVAMDIPAHEALASYQRMLPSRDELGDAAFGDAVDLPLEWHGRAKQRGVFIDVDGTVVADPWPLLACVRCWSATEIELATQRYAEWAAENRARRRTVESGDAPRRRRAKTLAPWPNPLIATLADRLVISRASVDDRQARTLLRFASFRNPDFDRRQRLRLSTRFTPVRIHCGEETTTELTLPRGLVGELSTYLTDSGSRLALTDTRSAGQPLAVRFRGRLFAEQETALGAMLEHESGLFVAPPGTGKTVFATALIAARARNTLVIVHRRPLLDQWLAQIETFLADADGEPVVAGKCGGGKRALGGAIDVAMIQSLMRLDDLAAVLASYGHVIVDECHHIPARSFEQVTRRVAARYVCGLTATPERRDGLERITTLELGPIRHRVEPRSQARGRALAHELIVREVDLALPPPAEHEVDATTDSPGIAELYSAIAADTARNERIFEDVVAALEAGRSPLLLTERRDHLARLAERLEPFTRHLVVLHGGMNQRQRRALDTRMAAIPDDDERLLIATGKYIGEGFDDPRLDTLFLTMPIAWRGTLVQYAGRLHRQHHAKTGVRIVDYVDRNVPMLARMFQKRLKGYRAMGYKRASSS